MLKKFTVYGNCQSTVLAACLQRVDHFRATYEYHRIPFCHRITSNQYQQLSCDLKGIDLLITQPVSSAFRGGGFESIHLSQLAKTSIGFPSLQFYGYFPSLSRFKLPKLSPKTSQEVNNCLSPYAPLKRDSLYHYNEIREMYLNQCPTGLICQKFDEGQADDSAFKRCLDRTLNHLRQKESECKLIPMSDYIQDRWQTEHLFYTPRHPSGAVMAELVKRICNQLELTVREEELEKIRLKDHFSSIKLYIPAWIRRTYLRDIPGMNDEKIFSMTAVDTVSLYTRLYCLMPSALDS